MWDLRRLAVAIAAGIVGIIVISQVVFPSRGRHEAEPQSSEAVTPTDKASSQPAFATEEGEVKDQKYIDAIGVLIRRNGYECPHVTMLWITGTSPYGPKLEALCGPIGSTDSDDVLHYSVYPDKFVVTVCKPFGVLGGGCD
jgi:hypothetical protein